MLFPLSQLIEGRDAPVCVHRDMSIKDALAIMIEHDFSQLPVIDDHGNLLGIISDQALAHMMYHLDAASNMPTLPVGPWVIPAETLPPDHDLVEAVDRLNKTYSIVVVEGRKPVGILTYYDTTHFFREFSEGLILVRDIELTLRQYIEGVFTSEHAMKEALRIAFGPDRRDSSRPARVYDEMTLREHVQLIVSGENWPKFESIFGPKDTFERLMKPVIKTRNQIAHFREQITKVQINGLKRAVTWLDNCPKVPAIRRETTPIEIPQLAEPTPETEPESVPTAATPKRLFFWRRLGKYEPLAEWLKGRDVNETEIRVSIDDIERLLGDALPPYAAHRSWWANDHYSRSQSIAWLRAGWRVKDVDFEAREVTFQRTNEKWQDDGGTL